MKGIVKCVIAGAIIIGIGLAIVLGTLAFNGWSVKKPEFEMQTYTATEDNKSIKIDLEAGSVKTEFYEGETISIDYPTSNRYRVTINEKDGVLTFENEIKAFALGVSSDLPDMIIRLPAGAVIDIDFDMGAGSAILADGVYGNVVLDIGAGYLSAGDINCEKLDLDLNAGSVKISSVSCKKFEFEITAGNLRIDKIDSVQSSIEVNAGNTNIGFTGAKEEYNISADVSVGSCNVSNQNGTTEKSIDVEVNAGSITLGFSV